MEDEDEVGSSFALDVNAIFGDDIAGPSVWYYVKMGCGRNRKVYFLEVSNISGTCTINDCRYDLTTVNNVEIRKVFRDVRFPAKSPWTATLDINDLQEVQKQYAEWCSVHAKQ